MTAHDLNTDPSSSHETRAALNKVLADDDLMEQVTALPTYAEAVTAVLARAGMRAYTCSTDTNPRFGTPDKAAYICAIVAGDEVGECTLGHQQIERWTTTQSPDDTTGLFPTLLRGVRRRMVESKARLVASGNMSAVQILAEPLDDDRPEAVAFRTAVVGAWWQARLAQGHAPSSARMLLNLTCHPGLLSRLRSTTPDAPFFTAD